jgi:hypothetical protein
MDQECSRCMMAFTVYMYLFTALLIPKTVMLCEMAEPPSIGTVPGIR